MSLENLYLEIKSSISSADGRLGMRIASVGLWLTVVITIILSTGIVWWWAAVASIPYILQALIAGSGIYPTIGTRSKYWKVYHAEWWTDEKSEVDWSGFTKFMVWIWKKKRRKRIEKNHYNFEFIASFKTADDYVEYLWDNHEEVMGTIDEDIGEQIYTNACILKRKNTMYRWSSFIGLFLGLFKKLFRKSLIKRRLIKPQKIDLG